MAQVMKEKPVSAAEASSTFSPSEKKCSKSLKPVRKIVKKLQKQTSVSTEEAKETTQVKGKVVDEKLVTQDKDEEKSHNEEINDEKKLQETLGEGDKEEGHDKEINDEKALQEKMREGGKEKSHDKEINNEKKLQEKLGEGDKEKSLDKEINDEKEGGKDKNHNEEIDNAKMLREKVGDVNRSMQDEGGEQTPDSHENNDKQTNLQERNKGKNVSNEKHDEQSSKDQKSKENLGGLIFMCNERTRPDCFRYGIMGVPLSMKELVMSIKPGLKLFLYDVDHKLMYGIYKASSSGGMNLEQAAFGGTYPLQVRFKVHKDCLPLTHNIFKKAIKENYIDKKNRFKTQLTSKQVRKLIELFQPYNFQSNVQCFVPVPPPAIILQPPTMPTPVAHEYIDHQIELPFQGHLDPDPRNSYYDESRKHYKPTASLHKKSTSKYREAAPLDHLFLSEKEYRTYGLRKAPLNSTSIAPSATPTLDSYSRDPYHSHHSVTAPSDPYPRHHRNEPMAEPYTMAPIERVAYDQSTYDSSQRGVYGAGGLYSTHASNTLSEYNHYMGMRGELASPLDSLWYSFAGQPFSY